MAYATINDVKERLTRTLSAAEENTCGVMLDDIAVIIDSYSDTAPDEAKKIVSCRAVIRALGDSDSGVPMGSTQGSVSALGYSQSWTIGSGGGAGELYLSKLEKNMLGAGNSIGSYSPLEDL